MSRPATWAKVVSRFHLAASRGQSDKLTALREALGDLIVISPSGCWIWLGAVGSGYGATWDGSKTVSTHRIAYKVVYGNPPLDALHHACGNTLCMNPQHLVPMSRGNHWLEHEPSSQKKFCVRGHELSSDNLYIRSDGYGRNCKLCDKIRRRRKASQPGNKSSGKSTCHSLTSAVS